jgi:hypothetical protein
MLSIKSRNYKGKGATQARGTPFKFIRRIPLKVSPRRRMSGNPWHRLEETRAGVGLGWFFLQSNGDLFTFKAILESGCIGRWVLKDEVGGQCLGGDVVSVRFHGRSKAG